MSTDAAPSFLAELEQVLVSRLDHPPTGSYSHRVLTDSVLAQRKIMEEAFEVCLELGSGAVDQERLAEEAADLVFHVMCGVVGAGGSWSAVEQLLRDRHEGDR